MRSIDPSANKLTARIEAGIIHYQDGVIAVASLARISTIESSGGKGVSWLGFHQILTEGHLQILEVAQFQMISLL